MTVSYRKTDMSSSEENKRFFTNAISRNFTQKCKNLKKKDNVCGARAQVTS
jgi:hypothetical protein